MKKIVDIIAGVLGTISLVPLIAVVWFIRICLHENEGPLFFEQIRYLFSFVNKVNMNFYTHILYMLKRFSIYVHTVLISFWEWSCEAALW